jgi:pyrroline-5-carboxylate reductase
MIVGFVGSGSMAAAMARGWSDVVESMLFSDSGSGSAVEAAKKVGGEAVASNAELAERADLVVLALKPANLEEAATELQDARTVISLLGATSLERLVNLFPNAEVIRVMPNIAVQIGQGVLCVTGAESPEARALLNRLGKVVDLPDSEFDAATAVMGCAPAYLALAVEAIADAGAADGLEAGLARELVVETTAGTAALLRELHPADVRKVVASPGGSTEAGLEALAQAHAREAFGAAVKASLERMRG